MASRQFSELLAEVETTVTKLEQAVGTNERHDLLLALKRLLREAEALIEKSAGDENAQ
jgi:hypothetical protein